MYIKEPKSTFKSFLINVADILSFLIFIIGFFLFIKVFVIAPVVVKGHSMLPNYKEGEYIFIDKFYRKVTNGLKRQDVVVIMPESSNVSFLKRLIGLPGETVEITGGYVYICRSSTGWIGYTKNDIDKSYIYNDGDLICKRLIEPYIKDKTVNLHGIDEKIVTTARCGIWKFKLGKNQYLVLGDDRMYSTDSRCCFRGFCSGSGDRYYVTKDEILGKIWGLKIF